MKTYNYPYLALGLGILLLVIIMKGSETDAEGMTMLPLLTLLIINECAFILTAAAVYIGIRRLMKIGFQAMYSATVLVCLLLSIQFMLLGIKLWPL